MTILATGGRPHHLNGTAAAATPAAVKVPTNPSAWIGIYNASGAQTLKVSFDGGVTYYTIAALGKLEAPIATTSLWVTSGAATADYQILWVAVA